MSNDDDDGDKLRWRTQISLNLTRLMQLQARREAINKALDDVEMKIQEADQIIQMARDKISVIEARENQ